MAKEGHSEKVFVKKSVTNGCDHMDQLVSYYSNLDRKTVKWWKRMFKWPVEVSQCNAYILFSLTHGDNAKRMNLQTFKEKLVK